MTDPDLGRDDARLRALLEDAVADVRPAPALDRIRSRTKVTPMRRTRPWLLATAGAVAATAATITVVSLANGSSPRADSGPGPAATSTDPSDETAEEPSGGVSPSPTAEASEAPSASGSDDPDPGGSVALPVYFVADTPTGPRLFREFRPAPPGTADTSEARLAAALQLAVDGDAADPDYRSDWREVGDGDHTVTARDEVGASSNSRILVQLDDAADVAQRPAGLSEGAARLAVQQLVHTAQAVVQERAPVAFADPTGRPLTTVLGTDASRPVAAAPALEVQAPVWIISPQEGEEVGRTFTVEGRGAFFEANVSWQLLDPAGAVVKKGFATAQECCTLSPYAFEVTAKPGTYVLRVYDADMSGGEGPGEQEDTKAVTVR